MDLRQALPGSGLGGLLSFDAEASGPLDALRARLQFPPGARLDVFDQAYVLPQGLSAEVRGDVLRLPRFTLAAPGAGQMAVQGELVFDRRLDLQLVIHNHRLDRLPFVARSLPSLSGQLAGNLRIHGHPQRLVADGELKLERVALGDDPAGRRPHPAAGRGARSHPAARASCSRASPSPARCWRGDRRPSWIWT